MINLTNTNTMNYINYQTFHVLAEDPITISFEIQKNEESNKAIEIFIADPAIDVLTLSDELSVKIIINFGKMDKSRIKYAPKSDFEIELNKFHFSEEAVSCLKEIRTNRSGKPAKNNAGRINTDFNFKTLYDWIRNGRVRFTKSSSIKNKRLKTKQFDEEIYRLTLIRDNLIFDKGELNREIHFFKLNIPYLPYLYTGFPADTTQRLPSCIYQRY